MSGTQITASTLVNKIVYRTDLNSLKKVRNDMRKLQKEFSKSNNQVAKAKQAADKQVYQAQIKQQRDIDKQQKQAAKQAAVDAKAKANEQKKLAAAQSKAAKMQLQQQAKTTKVNENAMLAQRKALFDIGRLQGCMVLNDSRLSNTLSHLLISTSKGRFPTGYESTTLTAFDYTTRDSQK
jgi:cell wall-associated NlpC family hydrolase